ncbi:hypothetical protein C1646_664036 [Rhizophagus diaphanus]|nr:hypothetical protein C1646_664036 [Rhizophagus diaphanus] [Rhizophagus sp. MUCL 43196]
MHLFQQFHQLRHKVKTLLQPLQQTTQLLTLRDKLRSGFRPIDQSELGVVNCVTFTRSKADLFTENFDLKREVAKLREELGHRIEELEKNRADNDAENAELKVRVAKLEQASPSVDERPQNERKQEVSPSAGAEDDSETVAFTIEQHKKPFSKIVQLSNANTKSSAS